jgi:hypothetical protein
MRKSRFSEAQIVVILREFDAGAPLKNSADVRHSCGRGVGARYHPVLRLRSG